MEQSTFNRLNSLAEQLQTLYEPIRLSDHSAPVNRGMEAQRLLESHAASQPYNPQFIYNDPPEDWDIPLRQFCKELSPDDNPWEHKLAQDVSFTLDLMQAITTRDPVLTTDVTIRAYGKPTEDLVQSAYAALDQLSSQEDCSRNVPADQMAEKMQQALQEIDLTDWSVLVLDTMSASMSVRAVERQVRINAKNSFTEGELTRLLVHEIGTHVFRSANGKRQPLKLLRFGLFNYMATEEGLANYHEAQYGVQTSADQRRYALRVIAADLSLTQSFYEVFCELVNYTTFDEAFSIASRAKRGFTDTSLLGCHVKDKVYFEGFLHVSNHLKHHPDDYSRLMCGKVSLDMLEMLADLEESGFLDLPAYLPGNLKIAA
jgi:hypothetical protein